MTETMNTSPNYDDFIEPVETAEEKQARENRLRIAEIKRKLKAIDNERIRPLAAIVSNKATEYDSEKLANLEDEAATLRMELSELGGTE